MKQQKVSNLFNVAIYIRLSREDGDKQESDSVVTQKKLLTKYVNDNMDLSLYDTYIDDGLTGTNFNRPSFERMMEDVRAGKVNCIIVKDLSRFGRDYIHTGLYLERIFPELGVRFISINDNIDSLKGAYDMLLPIKNIFNEQYARDISSKVHSAYKTKQQAGEFLGAFACYGYQKSTTEKGKLVIDEYAADVVRRIFSLYIEGNGYCKIASILNSENILSPTEYKKTLGIKFSNGMKVRETYYWSHATIKNILTNELYIGNMVQGKIRQYMRGKAKPVAENEWIRVENTHEAIIDIQTWERVRNIMSKNFKPSPKSERNIFAGFLKCGDCGLALVKKRSRISKSGKEPIANYYCSTYQKYGKNYCTTHKIRANVLEEFILNDLRKVIQSIDNLNEFVKSQKFSVSKANKVADNELKKIESELETIKKRKKSALEWYADGMITKEECYSYCEDYQKTEELYSKQLEALKKRKDNTITENIFEKPWLKHLLELRDIEVLDREIIVDTIHEIRIYKDNTIKIFYNFSDELEHLFSNVDNSIIEKNVV